MIDKRSDTASLYSFAAVRTCRGKYPRLIDRLSTAVVISACAVRLAMLLLTISSLLCSNEKNNTSSPAAANWSASCVQKVVLPKLLIAPTT